MRYFRNVIAAIFLIGLNLAHAQVNVTTYHYDNNRSGANTQETILTPANVNSTQFGKLFSTAVDGYVYAQPLYLAGVSFSGATHNVLYVATEHDSVYAIDADTGAVLSQVSLIPSGGTTVNSISDLGCTDIIPEIGITGTPVIDPTTSTMYLVAKSNVSGNLVQYLHALDTRTLAEKFGGPILIQGSVPGVAKDGNGTTVSFNSKWHNQRTALVLENGHVLISWGSHCDITPWHGWLMSYNAATLAQEAVWNSSPNGNPTSDKVGCNGIWMSGSGPAVEANGNIYLATGNGNWNGTSDYGDSIVKLGPPSGGAFPVLDYFTPYNQGTLASDDTDVGAGGLTLLPSLSSGTQLLAHQGKQGTIYLLNRNNLGKYCVNNSPACTANDPQIVQEIPGATSGIWGAPAFWNGNLYWTGANDSVSAFSFNANNSGLISTTPTSRSPQIFAFAAPTPSVSANGSNNGIVWALDGSGYLSTCSGYTDCQVLYAFSATNLGTVLYSSDQASNARDVPGGAVKFTTPVVANGKVYVGSQYSVSAFGLLSSSSAAASPVFNPAPSTYSSAQSVTLSDSTAGAKIYYTTNGTTPTSSSSLYVAGKPITISSATMLQAIAVASGYSNSLVTAGNYFFTSGPVPANFGAAADVDGIVTVASSVPNGGLDGQGNAYASNLTGTVVSWSGSLFALGAPGTADAASNTTIPLAAGSYASINFLATGVNGNQLNQTFTVTYTDGTQTTYTQSLSDWGSPQSFAGESIVLTMASRLTPTGQTSDGPFYLYGYSFAINSSKKVASLKLPNNRSVVVLAVDLVPSSGSGSAAATPTLNPTPGTYSSAQTVTMADTTPGATIYYTTDGRTPSTASSVYSASSPPTVSATTTVEAIAVASGYSNSAVASGTYTITSGQGTTPISVSLTTVGNLYGLVNSGTAVPGGLGIDRLGNAYAANLAGASLTWSGSTYKLGTAGTLNAVSSTTITLPAGVFSNLSLLGTGINGNQTNQNFVVTYTDGTTSTFTQSLSDWFSPQGYSGESTALSMAYRVNASGATQPGPFNIYGYSFALNTAKTVASLKLPSNLNVAIVAIDLTPSSGAPSAAATPTLSPATGTYTSAQTVTMADATPGATIYYTTNGTTPSTTSSVYSASSPPTVSTTTTIEALAVASGYTNSAVASAKYTIAALPTAATPTLSPAAGTYTSAQTVTMADATPGATIYYTTNGTTPSTTSSVYSASSPPTVSATSTVEAIAVASGYANSAVASATYTISAGPTPVSVNLASSADLYGLVTLGTAVPGGQGIDRQGNVYAANLIGTSLTWSGSTFSFGASGTENALTSATITLPSGKYASLNLLGTGVSGNQPNQTFVVTYTDGTTSTFTQGLSDWYTPQGYTGEATVLTMAYRVAASGAQSPGPLFLYGYSFALNSTKTVASLTLPSNNNVVILAVDLTPSSGTPSPAATPTLSPAAGTYTSAQTVTMADATPGATIYYTTNGTTPSTTSSVYSASSPPTVSATSTVEAIAVASGYANSAVASATYTISAGPTPVSVNLASSADLYGLVTLGTAVPGGQGIDRQGNVYAANLIGTSLTWSGSTFSFGASGTENALTSATITLPSGKYASLNLLGTGVSGNQPNQTFVVTYTDGTTSTFTQGLSDWYTPQGYTGEATVLTMAYRVAASGAQSPGPLFLYGYSFALNSTKTVASLTLPSNNNVVILAVDLHP